MTPRGWVHRRARTRRHQDQIHRQRMVALVMIGSGLLRVAIWALLILLYLLHVKFARNLYASVSFVALLSVLALLLTDWGQVAASLAQLAAGDVHHDVNANRDALALDVEQLNADVARLAELQPGPEGDALATEIRERLGKSPAP